MTKHKGRRSEVTGMGSSGGQGSAGMCVFPSTVIHCRWEQLIGQVHYCFATTRKPSLATSSPQGFLLGSLTMMCHFKEQHAYHSCGFPFLVLQGGLPIPPSRGPEQSEPSLSCFIRQRAYHPQNDLVLTMVTELDPKCIRRWRESHHSEEMVTFKFSLKPSF